MRTGQTVLMEGLDAEGVTHVFGNPGTVLPLGKGAAAFRKAVERNSAFATAVSPGHR